MSQKSNSDFAAKKTCQICGSQDWLILNDPVQNASVTTAGRIVNQPLGKSQCKNCGFLQRTRAEFIGFTDYYEQDYANYYNRPGTEEFHKKRYQTMIDWMGNYLPDSFQFKTVLDVGCGQGWAMDAFKNKYSQISITGLDPSHYNVKVAEARGFEVILGKVEELSFKKKFDLVYSNNVIQHVNDSKQFLKELSARIDDQGVIIVTCPDGSIPNIELLWADQNYSFLPEHLINLGKELGFEILYWGQSLENPSLPPAQLLLLTNNSDYKDKFKNTESATLKNINEVYKMRTDYLGSFNKISEYLIKEIGNYKNVFNFGASYWTSILAAYCPAYWEKINACVVDNNDGFEEIFGKKVLETKSINKSNSVLVLGTSPDSHPILKENLCDYLKVISWNHIIHY
jgi:SAM-dependent methyltransferase